MALGILTEKGIVMN